MGFPDVPCLRCSKPIRAGTAVAFLDGEVLHIRCWSRAISLRAMELHERSRTNAAHAEQLMQTAGDLVDEAKTLSAARPLSHNIQEGHRRLLVADGYTDARDALVALLKLMGHRVVTTGDGVKLSA
jgi:hypothetical protein